MAIGDDFTVTLAGNIRHASGTTRYKVLELHRWLQDLADDPEASGNDLIDITSATPSARSTDNIIDLLGIYNIDDDAAEYFYDGSITQDGGDTVYSGLRVLGAVNNINTQLMVIQDNDLYQYTPTPATPFWGDQSTGGFNGSAAAGILMRCMIKSRVNGADIDGQRIRVQARHWGDTYDFFNVQLGVGESVAAIGTTPDAQNDEVQGTVSAYTHITNTEGHQQIDLNNGNGNKNYYSKWTYGADTSGDGLKGMWEFIKDLTGNGTAKTLYSINGEFFLGITHSYDYDAGSAFTENETVVWGTDITYDTLAGGTFAAGDYVTIGASGAAGRVMYDNGSTNMIVALEDTAITLTDGDLITVADGVGAVTANINVTIVDNDKAGGSGLLLGATGTTTGSHYIQLLTGAAPVDNLPLRGLTSSATALVQGTVNQRTVPKIFLGSYTGSLIGAYGVGVLDTDLTASDTLQALDLTNQQPPNNVTFSVEGLVSGEDYVLVGPKAAGNDFAYDQLSLNTTLSGATETDLVVTAPIPSDTPASGTLRVQLDDGRQRLVDYDSWTGSTFTLNVADQAWNVDGATAGNNVMISYIDVLADAATETFTGVFDTPRALWIRVRDGGGTPIKTFESQGTLGSAGGSAVASRITDE